MQPSATGRARCVIAPRGATRSAGTGAPGRPLRHNAAPSALALLAAVLLLSVGPAAVAEEWVTYGGYAETAGLAAIPDAGDSTNVDSWLTGTTVHTRVTLDLNPSPAVSARIEADYAYAGGYLNPLGRYQAVGIGLPQAIADVESLPGADFNSTVQVDHAYATARFPRCDLTFGKMPISWGSSWLLNPTDRVNPRGLETLMSDDVGGVPAISVDVPLGWRFGLTGYALFNDSTGSGLARLDENRLDHLPLGLRIQAYLGANQISLGAAREVDFDPLTETYAAYTYALADFTGNIGDVGITAEAAFQWPGADNDSDWDQAGELLGAAVGATYLIPTVDVETLVEYIHLGGGTGSISAEQALGLMQGDHAFMGSDYLLVRASRDNARGFLLETAALANLGDGSVLVIPSIEWEPVSDVVFTSGLWVPIGGSNTEFGGVYEVAPGQEWRPWDAVTVSAGLTVYF